MQYIEKDFLKAMISCFLVLVSFGLGYIFAIRYYESKVVIDTPKYVEIVTKKSQIEIVSISEGVDIIVNGKIHSGGTIGLE